MDAIEGWVPANPAAGKTWYGIKGAMTHGPLCMLDARPPPQGEAKAAVR